MSDPVLIACSHGTSSELGRDAIRDIVEGVRALLPGTEVVQSFVDVEYPQIDEVVATTTAQDGTAIVVPLLLSAGYHTRVDISRAVAASPRAFATAPLGTHPLVAELVVQRLTEAGATLDDAVVLAAAGSSDPGAAARRGSGRRSGVGAVGRAGCVRDTRRAPSPCCPSPSPLRERPVGARWRRATCWLRGTSPVSSSRQASTW